MRKEIRIFELKSVSNVFGLRISKLDLTPFDGCDIYFSDCSFGAPLPMLLVGREIRTLIRNNPKTDFKVWTRNTHFCGYADQVGFFKYCGFNRGKEMGEASGSSNYIPITHFKLNNLRAAAGDRAYAEIMEEKATQLTAVLLQCDSGDVFNVIRERLKNLPLSA